MPPGVGLFCRFFPMRPVASLIWGRLQGFTEAWGAPAAANLRCARSHRGKGAEKKGEKVPGPQIATFFHGAPCHIVEKRRGFQITKKYTLKNCRMLAASTNRWKMECR